MLTTTGGFGSMFPLRRTTALHRVPLRASPIEEWRAAEHLVWTRWRTFLHSPPEIRSRAFAAYVAALDAEAIAAGDLRSRPLTDVA
jgi:hypothetical protein